MQWVYDCVAKALRWWFDHRISGEAILDGDELFPNSRMLTSNWKKISLEASRTMRRLHHIPRFHEAVPAQQDISASDDSDWRIFIMRAYGVTIFRNLAQCPTVADFLEKSPDVLSASFSILGPGKSVPAHRGPFRGVLRGYLVLSMPTHGDGTPAAVLTINRSEYRLHEGEFLLWDDTFEHAVRNESSEYRVVLLLDIKRPNMAIDLRAISSIVMFSVRLSIYGMRWVSGLRTAIRAAGKVRDGMRSD
jgi:aspartate beta-hydroxylase